MERRAFLTRLGGAAPTRLPVSAAVTVIEERDPARFRAAFVAAVGGGGVVALANPDWGLAERVQFERLLAQSPPSFSGETGWLLIPTGGSTGGVKLARHDQDSIAAAVQGYAAFFGEREISAVGVLPLHHVGGLMAWLRCALTGGEYRDASWRDWREGRFDERLPEGATVSLVPTQLSRLLEVQGGVAWLRRFRRVLIGGAATARELVATARSAGIAVVVSYGMTETAALIAATVAPDRARLHVLPHVIIGRRDDERLTVTGACLFRGYWPELRPDSGWTSADRGVIESDGRLRVLGRVDDIINSGGEKIDANEVTDVLRAEFGDERVAVIGHADARWGAVVVACYDASLSVRRTAVEQGLAQRLATFKRPRIWVPVSPWPVNALGKLNRAALQQAVVANAVGSS